MWVYWLLALSQALYWKEIKSWPATELAPSCRNIVWLNGPQPCPKYVCPASGRNLPLLKVPNAYVESDCGFILSSLVFRKPSLSFIPTSFERSGQNLNTSGWAFMEGFHPSSRTRSSYSEVTSMRSCLTSMLACPLSFPMPRYEGASCLPQG